MPFAYGYAYAPRTDMRSLTTQRERIKDYYNCNLRDKCIWGGVQSEDAKTIWVARSQLFLRPAGKKLVELVRRGDHVVFDQIDCVWSSIKDFVKFLEHFKTEGVIVHIVDCHGCSVATGAPMGDLMMTVMAEVTELKSKTASRDIRDTFALLREKYVWPNGIPLRGCKIVRTAGKKRLEFDDKARAIMGEIVRLHEVEGKSFVEIAVIMKPVFKKVRPRLAIHRLYRREKIYREMRIQSPIDLQLGENLPMFESLVAGYDTRGKRHVTPPSLAKYMR